MSRLLLIASAAIVVTIGSVGLLGAQTPDDETPSVESVCDGLQDYTPGLYGLCVAFCEAQDCVPDVSLENPFENCRPASSKILERYEAKKEVGDPEMPCIAPGPCRCFTAAELDSIPPQDVSGQYTSCDSTGEITSIIGNFSPLDFAQVTVSEENSCLFRVESLGIPLRMYSLDPDEAVACQGLLTSAILTSPYCP